MFYGEKGKRGLRGLTGDQDRRHWHARLLLFGSPPKPSDSGIFITAPSIRFATRGQYDSLENNRLRHETSQDDDEADTLKGYEST